MDASTVTPFSAATLGRRQLAVKWAKRKASILAIVLVMVAIGAALLGVEHHYFEPDAPVKPEALAKTLVHEAGMAILIAAIVGVALDFIASRQREVSGGTCPGGAAVGNRKDAQKA